MEPTLKQKYSKTFSNENSASATVTSSSLMPALGSRIFLDQQTVLKEFNLICKHSHTGCNV